ncbi:coenzyme F390 synthetase [Echinicola vietnamensis]|uniref:Coenzyme F390 synthetase n=1 Tax=Echinicola vietnamensis (strain DSM 17526 / LMG 23754 / KMM 6221) TaxID=926556 RepID=L0FRE9_ECHVK|nr:coenzyme F390 synthetase [Echinicola vietnamensis]AGA76494.1 coenzyme F390 synthetase [Echinicola vietnamensis DSM 17526]
MNYFKSFSEQVQGMNPSDFDSLAMELFRYQAKENTTYKAYLDARGVNPVEVKAVGEIPFLPIRFFKSHKVVSGPEEGFESFYSSSGTTGQITSRHFIWSEEFYLKHSQKLFEEVYGSLEEFHVLALLPAYLERKGSSLVAMADHFIKQSGSDQSGFYLYNYDVLIDRLYHLKQLKDGKRVLLLGVTFALLDLAEQFGEDFPEMDHLIVMETGGMKGRRKEMIREAVHENLSKAFKQLRIHSEYGMTELMSQAYSQGNGKYQLPASMRVMLRDVNDPLSWSPRKQGGINIIDLANFHSCAFIETQDLGRFDDEGMLEVLGRFDNSEIRGCNLMVN